MDAPSDIKVSPTVHNKIFNALEGQLFNEHDNCDMYKEIYRYKDIVNQAEESTFK